MKFHNHLNSWQVTTGCLQLAAVQLLCCVWFFVTPWTAAMPVFPVLHYLPEPAQTHVQWVGDEIQPSRPLSFPSPPALNLSQHQGLFQWFGSSHQVAKYWNFSISPSNEYSGLISFRIDWLDLLAVQGTLKSLLQYHGSKVWIHWHSAIFMVHVNSACSVTWSEPAELRDYCLLICLTKVLYKKSGTSRFLWQPECIGSASCISVLFEMNK